MTAQSQPGSRAAIRFAASVLFGFAKVGRLRVVRNGTVEQEAVDGVPQVRCHAPANGAASLC
jgi:hypothetical protein